MVGIAPEYKDETEYYTLQNVLNWRIDPIAATEIETRLASYGFDQEAISIDVYVQAREIFVLFESLLNAAQTKRMLLLRAFSRSSNGGLAGTRGSSSSADHRTSTLVQALAFTALASLLRVDRVLPQAPRSITASSSRTLLANEHACSGIEIRRTAGRLLCRFVNESEE
jgi:hypothetical protein